MIWTAVALVIDINFCTGLYRLVRVRTSTNQVKGDAFNIIILQV